LTLRRNHHGDNLAIVLGNIAYRSNSVRDFIEISKLVR
jgi:hypothetical protein